MCETKNLYLVTISVLSGPMIIQHTYESPLFLKVLIEFMPAFLNIGIVMVSVVALQVIDRGSNLGSGDIYIFI